MLVFEEGFAAGAGELERQLMRRYMSGYLQSRRFLYINVVWASSTAPISPLIMIRTGKILPGRKRGHGPQTWCIHKACKKPTSSSRITAPTHLLSLAQAHPKPPSTSEPNPRNPTPSLISSLNQPYLRYLVFVRIKNSTNPEYAVTASISFQFPFPFPFCSQSVSQSVSHK